MRISGLIMSRMGGMEKTRITFLADGLRRGGSEKQLLALITSLLDMHGFDVTVMLRDPRIEFDLSGLAGLNLDAPPGTNGKYEFLKRFRKHVSASSPDIVHTWEKAVATAAAVTRAFGKRSFRLVDGTSRFARPLSRMKLTYWVFRFNHAFSDAVVGNSAAALAVHGHRPGGRYSVIGNGLDMGSGSGTLADCGADTRVCRLVMTANFTEPKDHGLLIRAAQTVLQRGLSIEVHFLGAGPMMESARGLISETFSNRFVFHGSVSNVEPCLKECHAGVLLSAPGHAEGMSNAVMEYMAAGLPVICTDAGGNPEIVEDGVNGFLVPCSGREEVADAIAALAAGPELRARMGISSREKAESRFPVKMMVESYVSLYSSLLNR